jgi:ribonucleoside-diphosphate reductase alpha chain
MGKTWLNKTGGCASSQIEAAGCLIFLALRSGVKIDAIVKQLTGIRCPSPAWQDGKMVLSCPDAIAQVLKKLTNSNFVERETMMCVCPECGGIMTPESSLQLKTLFLTL